MYPSYNTAVRCTCALSKQNVNSCLVFDAENFNKDWNIFLKLLGEVAPLALKNNFRIILGLKSAEVKNSEVRKKLGILVKKECTKQTDDALT